MAKQEGILYDKTLGCLLGGVIGDAMGGPAENKTYREVREQFGEITDFTGAGTDDSALKHILCDVIIKTGGHPSADAWAEEWLAQDDLFRKTNLFYIPVKNAFWKIRGEGAAPREAGHGNMASSSSAMCISPMGIINAGNPRQAALETFEVASLIHHNYCRDAACAMAAAVAEAFSPAASVNSILQASLAYLPPRSACIMREAITSALSLACETRDYEAFREQFYSSHLAAGMNPCDARETVPVALALFLLADGDPRRTIICGANFGRDADTIASMAGAVAGACKGASSFPIEWVEKAVGENQRSQRELAHDLEKIAMERWDASLSIAMAMKTELGVP